MLHHLTCSYYLDLRWSGGWWSQAVIDEQATITRCRKNCQNDIDEHLLKTMAEVLIETAGPGNLQGRPQAVPWKRGVPQVFGWCLLIYCRQLYFVPQDLPHIQHWFWWPSGQIVLGHGFEGGGRICAWAQESWESQGGHCRRSATPSTPPRHHCHHRQNSHHHYQHIHPHSIISNAVNTTTTIIVIIAKIAIIIVIIAMTKHHYWKDRSRSKEQSARDLAAGEAVAGWQTRRTNEKHLIIQFS